MFDKGRSTYSLYLQEKEDVLEAREEELETISGIKKAKCPIWRGFKKGKPGRISKPSHGS